MLIRHKGFLLWFLQFGKVKGGVLYFLFWIALIVGFTLMQCLLRSWVDHTTFFYEFSKSSVSPTFILLIPAIFAASNFQKEANKFIAYADSLKVNGLRQQDVLNYAFFKHWEVQRRVGISKYIFYNRSVLVFFIIISPVFAVLALLGKRGTFSPEIITNSIMFIVITYFAITILNLIRWTISERKFARLSKSTIASN